MKGYTLILKVVMTTTMSLLLFSTLAGCVNPYVREPQPEATVREGDTAMNCQDIAYEYKFNTWEADDTIKRKHKDFQEEIYKGTMFQPLYMNHMGADGVEANALLDRNLHLLKLANNKSCDVTEWPKQPLKFKQ